MPSLASLVGDVMGMLVRHKYRILSVVLMLTAAFLALCFWFENSHMMQISNNAVTLQKSFLKETVNNVIRDIDNERETRNAYYLQILSGMSHGLDAAMADSPDQQTFCDTVNGFFGRDSDVNVSHVVVDLKTGQVLCDEDKVLSDGYSSVDGLHREFEVCLDFRRGDYMLVFGLSRKTAERLLAGSLHDRLHRYVFDDESYIWVNAVVNFDGGDGYAIRLIHPYLSDTEGMLLSTNMTDAVGDTPYLTELEGIKEHGELFSSYYFQRPQDGQPARKITYSKLYRDYGWIISMGSYYEDIEGEVNEGAAYMGPLRVDVLIVVLLAVCFVVVAALLVLFYNDRAKSRSLMQNMQRLLAIDAATGANSRRYLERALDQDLERCRRGERPALIMLMDIDDFHGHLHHGSKSHDIILNEVSTACSKLLRNDDCLAHYDADLFFFVLHEDVPEQAHEVFAHIQKAISDIPSDVLGFENDLTVSAGASCVSSSDTSFKEVVERCERAVEVAKDEGENNLAIFLKGSAEPSLVQSVRSFQKGVYLCEHLAEAIRDERIKVYYQPIIRAKTERVCCEEALSRWDDERYGFMSPGVFVPVLERARLIYRLDLYVVERVLKDFAVCRAAGTSLIPVSINLSRYDFEECDMVEAVSELCDRYGIDRRLLVIEVTESALAADEEAMGEAIKRFHDAGFSVWMDDFGSGFSSLEILRKFDFDLIKLDMSFVLEDFSSEKNLAILQNSINMAHDLGIEALSEGVEQREQADRLRAMGIDRMQGYLYDSPRDLGYILTRARTRTGLPFEGESR